MARRPWDPERAALLAFTGFNAFSLLGYGSFGLHPELLARFPEALSAYDVAYRLFSRGQVEIALAAILVPLVRRAGARWAAAFVVVVGLTFLAEWLGTTYGIPFGRYHYTPLLGTLLLGKVPWLIPLSWFTMAIPAWVMARQRWPTPGRSAPVILAGAALMTLWDLALDPAMSFLTPFWQWEDTGPYYTMPWVNLGGWFLTGAVIMAALAALGVDRWTAPLDARWMRAFYLSNLAVPLGMCALAGLGWAVLATTVALGIAAVVLRGGVAPASAADLPRGAPEGAPAPAVADP